MSAARPSTSSQRDGETVDERMFITCVQTEQGRAADRPPQCHIVSIRYLSQLAGKQHSNVPLPPEGNQEAIERGQVAIGPHTKYWRPGAYLYYSSSYEDLRRHLSGTRLTPDKERRLVLALEACRRAQAAYDRKLLLHQMGKLRHPGPPPKIPLQDVKPPECV